MTTSRDLIDSPKPGMCDLAAEPLALLFDLRRNGLNALRAQPHQDRVASGCLHLAGQNLSTCRNTLPTKNRHFFDLARDGRSTRIQRDRVTSRSQLKPHSTSRARCSAARRTRRSAEHGANFIELRGVSDCLVVRNQPPLVEIDQ